MLTKKEAQFLYQNGMNDLTAHTLDAAHAYKVVKFKNILRDVCNKINDSDQALYKELGIDEAFIKRFDELNGKEKLTNKEQEELATKLATDKRLGEMRETMLSEEASLSEAKTMPYEQWKRLQDENKERILYYRDNRGNITGTKELLMVYEEMLEGILWVAPVDAE